MNYQVLLYYNYTTIADPEEFAKDHLAFCKALNLKGRILVAHLKESMALFLERSKIQKNIWKR